MLWRYCARLGTDDEAAKLLLEVQRQDPSLPHTWFNLGIYLQTPGRHESSDRAVRRNAGARAVGTDRTLSARDLYRQLNRQMEAQAQFERAAELDPQLAAAPFQLYNLERTAGQYRSSEPISGRFPTYPGWCRSAG